MALFGKLFEKKECAICGGEIGVFGNRKLEDGNMCKNCEKKLSPWFDERRKSTIDQINQQLEYRENNKEKVASFRTTRTLGENMKVLLDEDAGLFMVTSARNLEEANPDVLAFSDVTGCMLDIDENKTEIYREGKDGQRESYNPPRYKYSYDFYITIHVRNDYFDEIRFRLNGSSVELENEVPRVMGRDRDRDRDRGRDRDRDRRGGSAFDDFNRAGRDRDRDRRGGFDMNFGRGGYGTSPDPERDREYIYYKEMGEEIEDALMQVRQQARDEAAAAAAPKAAVICPSCGATTTVGAAGICEFCGSAIQ